jgi:hypothetical protein
MLGKSFPDMCIPIFQIMTPGMLIIIVGNVPFLEIGMETPVLFKQVVLRTAVE